MRSLLVDIAQPIFATLNRSMLDNNTLPPEVVFTLKLISTNLVNFYVLRYYRDIKFWLFVGNLRQCSRKVHEFDSAILHSFLNLIEFVDHFWIFAIRYTLWFPMVLCHFLFTSTQFARVLPPKCLRMLSLKFGNLSKMVSIVNFCEFWIWLFFVCDFKWLFGFVSEPMSPLIRSQSKTEKDCENKTKSMTDRN